LIKGFVFLSIIMATFANSNLAINIGPFQLTLFRIIFVLLVSLVVTNFLLKKKRFILYDKNKMNNYSIKFMILWTGFAFFSIIWIHDLNGWLISFTFIAIGLIISIIYMNYLIDEKDYLLAFRFLSFSVLIHNLLGWYEVATGNYFFLSDMYNAVIYEFEGYPTTLFGNTNDFATFMLFSIWVMYICVSNSKSSVSKVLNFGIMISSVLLLLLTESRANLLGLILSVFFFLILNMKKNRKKYLITGIFIGLLGLLLIIVLLNSPFLYDILGDLSSDNSDSVRLNLIRNGLIFLISTLGFGVGAGNIEFWMANRSVYPTLGVINIHNWWLEILVGYGLLIFILYVVFYWKLMKSMYKNFIESKENLSSTLSLGMLCFLIGFIVASVSSSSNINKEWLWIFWAIVIAFQGLPMSSEKHSETK